VVWITFKVELMEMEPSHVFGTRKGEGCSIYMEMIRAQCCGRLEPASLENGFETELGTFKFEVGEIMETRL